MASTLTSAASTPKIAQCRPKAIPAPVSKSVTGTPQRVKTLIGGFQYGKLKKAGVVPQTVMFNDVPKTGGSFPAIARKLSPTETGILVEKAISWRLTHGSFSVTALYQIFNNIWGSKYDKLLPVLTKDYPWFEKTVESMHEKLSAHGLGGLQVEPEWTYKSVQGHPDIVTEDTIYDIKMTGLFGRMRIPTIFQILAYYALAQHDPSIPTRRYVGVILPAQDTVIRIDLGAKSSRGSTPHWDSSKYMDLLQETAATADISHQERDALAPLFMMQVYPYVGSHVNKGTTLLKTVTNSPANPAQIFFSGRQGSKREFKFSDKDIAATAQFMNANYFMLFIHAPYAINISRPDSWVKKAIARELDLAVKLGCYGVVIHIGRKVTMTLEEAIENMRQTVISAAAHATKKTPLLIETDSGGSVLDDPKDLAAFYLSLPANVRQKIGICLDTCHVFAAGHDIVDTLEMFATKQVPVRLIHYNDSKHPFGSKLDRHAVVGTGLIPFGSLYRAGVYATENFIPMVHE